MLGDLRGIMGTIRKPFNIQILIICGAIFMFLLAIHLIGYSFQTLGGDFSEHIQMAFANPAIGLLIGLLSTAILQSSSTTTSMIVAAVASGSLTLQHAIPVVMGANIGTTLTSTIVAMSYVTKTAEFKKAISAGTVHDIFNVLTCLILFPLEIRYGILTKLSQGMASFIRISSEPGKPFAQKFFIFHFFDTIGAHLMSWFGSVILLILSIVLLAASVKLISNVLYNRLIGKTKERFESIAFNSTSRAFGWGFLLTAIIQSSSLTTALIVPLAATGKVTQKRAFEFIVGANIGTTITAILAALFKSEAAISLAFAHFLFNTFGMIVFLGIPLLGRIPLYLADQLGSISLKFKVTAFAYIMLLFFILPFTLIYFSRPVVSKAATEIMKTNAAEK